MAFVRCLILVGAIALVASINGPGQTLRARLADTDRRFESIPLNFRTGFGYRLFAKAEVNLNGPFYQGSGLPTRRTFPFVDNFPPNSREARVTLLLHELGHLIRKSDGQWVLRDDGNDAGRSGQNTQRVIEACGKQIRELRQFSFEEELQAQLNARTNQS